MGQKGPRSVSDKTIASTTKGKAKSVRGTRHQLSHQVHHVQLVDESVHNALHLMKKSIQKKRKSQQLQSQLQGQRHHAKRDGRNEVEEAFMPATGVSLRGENKREEDEEERNIDSGSAVALADDNNKDKAKTGLLTFDKKGEMRRIKINNNDHKFDKTINKNNNGQDQQQQQQRSLHSLHKRSSPTLSSLILSEEPSSSVSSTTVSKNRHAQLKKKNHSRQGLLSAYESIIFSESQIPIFLRRQDDLLRQGAGGALTFRLGRKKDKKMGMQVSQKNINSHVTTTPNLRHDNTNSQHLKANNNNDYNQKMGVAKASSLSEIQSIVDPTLSSLSSSSSDISGIETTTSTNSNVDDTEYVHDGTRRLEGTSSELEGVEINHNPADPKITKQDKGTHGGESESTDTKTKNNNHQDSENTVVAQLNLDSRLVLPAHDGPSSPTSSETDPWELQQHQQGDEGRASGHVFVRHQPNHPAEDPSRRLSSSSFSYTRMHDNINFEAPSSVWILLLGVIACAAIVKKVYVKSSRGRNKRSASSHAFKASTDSLMTAFDSKDATIHIP